MIGRSIRYLLPCISVLAVVAACSSSNPAASEGSSGVSPPPSPNACATPNEGCDCGTPGEVVDCGSVKLQVGNELTCSMGKRTCQGAGKWGACVGTHLTTQTYRPPSMRALALTNGVCPPSGPLSNPCDPYCNQWVEDSPIVVPGAPSTGTCAYVAPADANASYLAIPASHRRMPAACSAGTSEECGHDHFCDPPGGAACTAFNPGETHLLQTGVCSGAFEFNFATPCDDGGTPTFTVCNRGSAPASAGVLSGLIFRESLVGRPTDVSLHKPPVNATIRGTCSINLATTPIGPGSCRSFARDTLCPGADWTGGGTNISTIQWNMPDWGGAPDPARIAGECMDKNNFTVYTDGALLACAGQACSATSSLTLKTTANGLSGCAPGPEMAPAPAPFPAGPCNAGNQYLVCQQDHRCNIATGTCQWNGAEGYFDSALPANTIDVTIGAACRDAAGETIPVCNRGTGTIPAGTALDIYIGTSGPAPDSCAPAGGVTCTAPVGAAGLAPGKCQNVSCAVPGNKYAIVQVAGEAAGMCANNQAYVQTGGSCAACTVCDTRITGKVYDPSGVGSPLAPDFANNLPLAGISVFQPAGALTSLAHAAVSCDTCTGTESPSITKAVTNAAGDFTLSGVTPGTNVRVVVQSGRWRREITVPTVTACAANAPANGTFRLPRNQTDFPVGGSADIPKIAYVTGDQESLGCLMRRIGITSTGATAEIRGRVSSADTNRIQVWRDNGWNTSAPAAANVDGLLNQATLDEYDALVMDCVGGDNTGGIGDMTATQQGEMVAYANKGGRLFVNHWTADVMITEIPAWTGTSTWDGTASGDIPDAAYIQVGTAPQQLFLDWMQQSASAVAPAGSRWTTVQEGKSQSLIPNATNTVQFLRGHTSNPWAAGAPPAAPAISGDYNLSYTFETPLVAPNHCGTPGGTGRVVVNSMHVSPARGSGSGGTFPTSCVGNGVLSNEEKALEYQFFQLTACQLGGAPPPPPPPALGVFTTTRDFEGICPVGTRVKWKHFFWQSVTPPGTNIQFRAATADTTAALPAYAAPPGPATSVDAGTASGATIPVGSWMSATNTVDQNLLAASQTSKQFLRIYITMNPIGTVPPILTGHRQDYSCEPAE